MMGITEFGDCRDSALCADTFEVGSGKLADTEDLNVSWEATSMKGHELDPSVNLR